MSQHFAHEQQLFQRLLLHNYLEVDDKFWKKFKQLVNVLQRDDVGPFRDKTNIYHVIIRITIKKTRLK